MYKKIITKKKKKPLQNRKQEDDYLTKTALIFNDIKNIDLNH